MTIRSESLHPEIKKLFRQGSKTYFNSSIFFPENVRRDVFILYGFVRKADNFVDVVPQRADEFRRFCSRYYGALNGVPSGSAVIDEFVGLMKRKNFDPEWIRAFLGSMEMDLVKTSYDGLDEVLEYIYGSAEVIGLMMARIMELPDESLEGARLLGRAMQYINFIRDINEDNTLGRTYLPLTGSGLTGLSAAECRNRRDEFISFIRGEIKRYLSWQREAEKSFRFIPGRYLVPIKTASDMYVWTSERICRNPLAVFSHKIKPSRPRIILRILYNMTIVGLKTRRKK
jgi:phytoene synthase